ncbi:ABC transporter permease [Paenibacillus sp. MMS20-IR301]|uniref:ABC transporter permease n=1 Tax=Paenibacillus sp. MMS20-IR301 TaxID=2895946 RepID=UPI0028F053BA|nr:ABC transporter permease [Paenibacillus sp. MMS20-IR301]WNS45142.1 ABC transporter permease [Paenibacillus sp. MMS20-IR301]
MTFRDIAFKNFKQSARNFFSYFLCSTFAITIFFLYAALYFNRSIRSGGTEEVIRIVFLMSLVALTLFSVFFINYAHSSFIKARSKEFAILMSLGMHQAELQKITALENLLISLISMVTGIVTGAVFSRLFQNVAIDLLDLQGVSFSLDAASFAVTAAVFIVIFAVSQLLSMQKINKLELTELMKDSRRGDNKTDNKDGRRGILGAVLLLLSVIYLVVISSRESLNTHPLMIGIYILMSFTGVYMVIAYFGNTIVAFLRNKKFYYHHILPITEIHHKFNQNKRILFILSILSGMTIFLVASPFSLLQLSASIAERNPYDAEFVQVDGVHALTGSELEQLLKHGDEPVRQVVETSFLTLQMNLDGDKYDRLKSKPVISQEAYERLTGNKLEVPEGGAVNIITAWEPGNHGIAEGEELVLSDGDRSFSYKVAASYHGEWFATPSTYPSSSGVVVNTSDYEKMLADVGPGAIAKHYGIDFVFWKGTGKIIHQLKELLDAGGADGSGKLFPVASKLDSYNMLKQNYSLFVFVTSLIGVLFFAAGGMVLYFKQYTEMGNSVSFFRKLYKIGISDQEIRRVVSAELLITFFVPLVLGSVFGYCFIYLITHVMSGADIMSEFMKNTSFVVAIYFVFQLSFYYITKRKYSREVIGKLTRAV